MTKPTAHTVHLWAASGALAGAALAAIAWLFFINPTHNQTKNLNTEAAATTQKAHTRQTRLNQLHTQNQNLADYQAQLTTDRAALPTTPDTAALLRHIQTAADTTTTSLTAITIGSQTTAATTTPTYGLPISVTATGQPDTLNRFLDQLQQTQPRAILITATNLTTTTGKTTLTTTFTAFVSPTTAAVR